MEESVNVEQGEITPEMFEGEQVPEETPPPKVESLPTEPEKVEEKTPEAEEVKPPETEDPKVEETEKPLAKADERKAQLNTEIRDLVAQRNSLKVEVEKANAEVYQPATENELIDQGLSATDARVEALRQEIEMGKYNERVADAQLTIGHESNRVLQDFPIFNPDSDEYDKELGEEAAALLQANLILDPNTNQVIGSNVSPYQLYKTLARASGISATKGQLKGQQDTEQMLANADVGSSAAPPKQKVDPLEALWAEPL